ncbi:MoaD family protein [Clostridia bacterium]|nr:MoaD family protein [Clostridia bacterium]
MAVTLLIPTALRAFTDRKPEVDVSAATAGEAIAALAAQYPDIRQHIYDEDGALRSFINVFLGDTNIKNAGGMDAALKDGDTLMLVPAIAGGAV